VQFWPGKITAEALADFAGHRRYFRHQLHGTFGNVLDIVVDLSGRPVEHPRSPGAGGPSISFEAFDEKARAALPGDAVRRLHDKIEHALLEQLVSGKPTDKGEIIIEGACSLRSETRRDVFAYDAMTWSSLASIIGLHGNYKSQAKGFLQELVRQGNPED
jgi:hypothetical protein